MAMALASPSLGRPIDIYGRAAEATTPRLMDHDRCFKQFNSLEAQVERKDTCARGVCPGWARLPTRWLPNGSLENKIIEMEFVGRWTA